jgi:hypothetical protein
LEYCNTGFGRLVLIPDPQHDQISSTVACTEFTRSHTRTNPKYRFRRRPIDSTARYSTSPELLCSSPQCEPGGQTHFQASGFKASISRSRVGFAIQIKHQPMATRGWSNYYHPRSYAVFFASCHGPPRVMPRSHYLRWVIGNGVIAVRCFVGNWLGRATNRIHSSPWSWV